MERSEAVGRGHGKVILLGEHSVVYGKPAIAAGLSRGCVAQAVASDAFALQVEPWGVEIRADEPQAEAEREQLREAFVALCEDYRGLSQPLSVRACMEIPSGAGLGGSAALSVAVLRAMDARAELSPGPQRTIDASLRWERVYHGNPSGIDSTLAVCGGLVLYRRGHGVQPIAARAGLVLVIGHSGEPGMTKSTVAGVARQYDRDPARTQKIFDAIEALVDNARTALEAGELSRLGQLMDMNQQLLSGLLVSTQRLESMCNVARQAGALGAKLTGGGGGGCMIALAHGAQQAEPVARALRDEGFEAFIVEVA